MVKFWGCEDPIESTVEHGHFPLRSGGVLGAMLCVCG